jgi:hypothetical protein
LLSGDGGLDPMTDIDHAKLDVGDVVVDPNRPERPGCLLPPGGLAALKA